MKNSSTRNTVTKTVAPRTIVWVDPAQYVEGHGFRVSIVKEGEKGHYPTGVWPNDGTKTMPWFWGPTLADAEKAAIEYNRKLGISPKQASQILLQSMGLLDSKKPAKKPKRKKK